jgi:hypothetical protein
MTAGRALVAALVASVTTAGCVQMPTEKQGVADLRPAISFKVLSESSRDARVLVDEREVGQAGDFVEGKAALRVLPGTHLVRVVDEGNELVNQKIYLGDGVNRVLIVK